MEDYFPRGGVAVSSDKKKGEKIKTGGAQTNLFKESSEETSVKGKKRKVQHEDKKKIKKQKRQTSSCSSGEQMKVSLGQAEPLTVKTLHADMLVLGCVKEVKMYELIISLPNSLVGSVSITNISESYTDLLQKFAQQAQNGQDTDALEELGVSSLQDLFKVGMVLPCKVLEVQRKAKGRTKIMLTINPREVYQGLKAENIANGMILWGSVVSQEDHGYIVDIGVKKVQAFLKNSDAERFIQLYNDGYSLRVGQCVMCCVQTDSDRMEALTGHTRTISLTIDPKKVKISQMTGKSDVSVSSLCVGMKVTGKIIKTTGVGISVRFLSHQGIVHKSNLPQSPLKYDRLQEVEACILYINPLTKACSLSLEPHLVDYNGVALTNLAGINFGDIFEEAVVKFLDKKKGIFLELMTGMTGFASLKNLSDKEVSLDGKDFKRGTSHRCRVVDISPMENLVHVTLKGSILSQKFLKLSDVTPGTEVECTVASVEQKGVVVKLTSRIKGFIPNMHLADVTLKHPEKKFTEGKKLKCRVLMIDKKKSNLIITHKKSLVNTRLPIVTDYDQCEPGMELEGFIFMVKEGGVVVKFFNDVTGWVPKSQLSTEVIEYPEKVFYKGQVVRCKVLKMEERKIILTFLLNNKSPFGKMKAGSVPEDFKVGKLVDVKVQAKTEKGLDVELLPSGKKAFLPRMHLSDSTSMCRLLQEMYAVGDIVKNVMYVSQTNNMVVVTKRRSMIDAAKKGCIPEDSSKLMPGMDVPASIHNIVEYGVFLRLPSDVVCLVPSKFTTDRRLTDLSLVYKEGQAVCAKIIQLDQEKQRFMGSLRMEDCYHGDTDIGLDLLKSNINERNMVLKSYSKRKGQKQKLCSLNVGSIYEVTVTEVTDKGFLCQLDSGVKGIVTNDHMDIPVMKTGEKLSAVLLYVDLESNCVELDIAHDLVKAVNHRHTNPSSRARTGQTLKSKVLLVKEDLVLVALKGHAAGQLGYLPARRHLNDVLERHQFTVGQENKVFIKSDEDAVLICSLKLHEDKKQEDDGLVQPDAVRHNFKLGDIVKASIRSVMNEQINLKINHVPGRVHISETVDTLENGTKPFDGYSKDQEVTVKIIGFQQHKTRSFLAITHRNFKNGLPECSMKPSKLREGGLKPGEAVDSRTFSVGDKCTVYVQKYFPSSHCLMMSITPTVNGKVYILNISNDLKVLHKPQVHFKPGQGYAATVVNADGDKFLELSLTETRCSVSTGAVTKGLISKITQDVMMLKLADGYHGTVGWTDVTDCYREKPFISFRVGQIVHCVVLTVEEDRKMCAVSLRQSRMKKNIKVKDADVQAISDLKEDQILRGYVLKCSPEQIIIRLGNEVTGSVTPDHIPEEHIKQPGKVFYCGKLVTTKVLSVDLERKHASLSLLNKDTCVQVLDVTKSQMMETDDSAKGRRRQSSSSDQEEVMSPTRKRKNSDQSEQSVSASSSKQKRLSLDETPNPIETVTHTKSLDSVNKSGKARRKRLLTDEVVETSSVTPAKSSKGKEKPSAVRQRKLSGGDTNDRTSDSEVNDSSGELNQVRSPTKSKKNKLSIQTAAVRSLDIKKDGALTSNKESVPVKVKKKRSSVEEKLCVKDSCEEEESSDDSDLEHEESPQSPTKDAPRLQLSAGFSWDTDFRLPTAPQQQDTSDDSDAEEMKKRRKKTREEIRKEKEEEEKRLYKFEREQLEGDAVPQSADDFDRLVVQSPDSSIIWLRYMAHHLETSEIDKARSVAERALKTISFREEQEKMNVWVALLNLENMYGSSDSVKSVLDRAVQQSDTLTVYQQMINIYVKSGKMEDAEHLHNILVKKYSMKKGVWLSFGHFYFQNGRLDSARKLLQRSLKSLENKDHVETIAKFAQLEFKYGEPERGKTMFENILSNYPRRTDLWSVYIDMVKKLGQPESTRQLFERVITLKLSAKKMKFFFKKYLDFEQQHGTETSVASVKQKALEYVESRGFVDE